MRQKNDLADPVTAKDLTAAEAFGGMVGRSYTANDLRPDAMYFASEA